MSVQISTLQAFKKISMPRLFLHLEGMALLAGVLVLYSNQKFSWGSFALFLFTPDLVMIIYILSEKWGKIVYNLVHTTIFPLGLGIASVLCKNSLGLQISLIWLAHIGLDRTVGYGFKYPDQPKETHFSRI